MGAWENDRVSSKNDVVIKLGRKLFIISAGQEHFRKTSVDENSVKAVCLCLLEEACSK